MRAIIVSDVHLEDLSGPRERHFLEFLETHAAEVDRLYVLGDLFDVWPGTSQRLLDRFEPVFRLFAGVVNRGGEVHYVEGNHDFQLGKSLEKKIGVKVHLEQIRENWDGQKILFCHGDTVNEHDVVYLRIRKVLRSFWFRLVRFVLPDRLSLFLGTTASRYSRDTQAKRPDNEARRGRIKDRYREIVGELFKKGNDVVIMGHTHIPEDYRLQIGDRPCRYLNSGDWMSSFTFIRYDQGEFELCRFPIPKA